MSFLRVERLEIYDVGARAKSFFKKRLKKGLFSKGGYGVIIFRVEGISAVIV